MNENELAAEIKIIKQILIVQLVMSGISMRDISKITGMSSATLYKFLPKNLVKNKESKS